MTRWVGLVRCCNSTASFAPFHCALSLACMRNRSLRRFYLAQPESPLLACPRLRDRVRSHSWAIPRNFAFKASSCAVQGALSPACLRNRSLSAVRIFEPESPLLERLRPRDPVQSQS